MKRHNMTSKKTILAIPLMAIAVIAIGFGMTSNVFATTSSSTVRSDNVDQQGQNDGQYGDQTGPDTAEKQGGVESPESSAGAADKDNLQQ
ncbi:MAG: hypothetical protein KGH81_07960 [Thaumarchaeota archaeon]|nr:hypothetical protein [Nitrososphaerota archaeon]